MLELRGIKKDYITGDTTVQALKGIDITFRRSEFVSILGPSGCGKTTMLNIVGGLDRYTEGDLIINGRSTTQFKEGDWDTYRNNSVGFVFQNYNLIPHLSVLGNVELALTLSGENKAERREKAVRALTEVGLSEQINKRPNQLSGGQMQRVAIARAIVNNPEIILADEPTGALDSKTSVQISDLLKEISKDRLIIMVTHNDKLAEQYSTRIIRLSDGEKVDDTNPYNPSEEELAAEIKADKLKKGQYVAEHDESLLSGKMLEQMDKAAQKAYAKEQKRKEKMRRRQLKKERRRTSMGFSTALGLSGRNLATKKGRTAMVSFAGSIGIIGIALVLSISNGFTSYINQMQTDTLAGFPITITPQALDVASMTEQVGGQRVQAEEFPDSGTVEIYTRDASNMIFFNDLSQEYIDYVKALPEGLANDVTFTNAVDMVVAAKTPSGSVRKVTTKQQGMMGTTNLWQEMLNSTSYMNQQYKVMAGKLPENKNEIALIVDKYNRLNATVAESLQLNLTTDANNKITFEQILEQAPEFKVFANGNLYPDGTYRNVTDDTVVALYDQSADDSKNITLNVVGVLRVNEGVPIELFGTGMLYHPDLTKEVVKVNSDSRIVHNQQTEINKNYGSGKNLVTDRTFYSEAGLSDQHVVSLVAYDTLKDYYAEDSTLNNVPQDVWNIAAQVGITKEMAVIIMSSLTADSVDIMKSMITVAQNAALDSLGGYEKPTAIYIYPLNFETKKQINAYLDQYNIDHPDNKVMYTDASELLASTMGNMVDIISYVLVAFAAVSLVVSSIMIGIITYVSVIERTKEIGVLRSIGARKKDISRVFNAETFLIGLAAGILGVTVAFLLTFPVNWIINAVIAANGASSMITSNLAVLNPLHALALIAVSVVLTLISGLIPSQVAAKKDPVVALRTE